jgi:hypothetical protein
MNNENADISWEMIGLGLEEPLPPQDVMDELSVHDCIWSTISY